MKKIRKSKVNTDPNICHRADHIREWFVMNQLWEVQDQKVADYVGCDRKTVGGFRRGQSGASIDVVEAMLNALGHTLKVVPIGDGNDEI